MPAFSRRKKYSETLQTLLAYQAAVDVSAIVSITDLEGRIIYVNANFTEISKYKPEELIGKTHSVINSGYHPKSFFGEMWQKISRGQHWRGEVRNRAKDGFFFWVDTVITPVLDKDGRAFQYLAVRNLITVQKEHERKLIAMQEEIAKREKQLREAQQVAKTGSWFLEADSNQLEWSEETYRIFEIPFKNKMTYESFLEKVHPEDRQMVNEAWEAALKSGRYEIRHRILTQSGEKWVSEKANFEFVKSSSLKSALGTVQDITEKKKIEDSLTESERLYKTLFNSSPFAIGIVDKKTLKFLEVNTTAIGLYGYSREEFLELEVYDIRDHEEHKQLAEQLSEGNYIMDRSIRTHKKKDGGIILVEPSITEMKYKDKEVYLIAIMDKTEKLKMQGELEQAKSMRQKELLEAQDQGRSELGREIHDNINQLLVASNLYFKLVRPSSDRDKELIKNGMDIISSANEEIRKLSASLISPVLYNENLKESVEHFSQNFQLTNTRFRSDVDINEDALPEGLKVNIYRIIQEQVNNIIKYAGATEVTVSVKQSPHLVTLQITDNGVGFDQEQKSKGVGLANIHYRAESYNGKVSIETGAGKGCKMLIEFILTSPITAHNK